MAQGVQILYNMSLEKGWFSDTSNVQKLKDIMNSLRQVIGAEMKWLIAGFYNTIKDMKFVTGTQVAEAIKATFLNIKHVGATIERFWKSQGKRLGYFRWTATELRAAINGDYMPGTIAEMVVKDVAKISATLKANDTDVPFDVLYKFIDMFEAMPYLFYAIMDTNEAGKALMRIRFVQFTDRFEEDLILSLIHI